MFEPLNPRLPMRTLSIGNIVTASLRLYLLRIKLYFTLALRACLWLIIPIYGWAKFFTILGMISRLAFCDLISQSENIKDSRRFTNSRIVQFLIVGILANTLLIIFLAFFIIGYLMVLGLIGFYLQRVSLFIQNSVVLSFSTFLGLIIIFSMFVVGTNWIYSRLFLSELTLAIDNSFVNSIKSIRKSCKLTKGLPTASRIQGIFIIAAIITLPIWILADIISSIQQWFLNGVLPSNSTLDDRVTGTLDLAILLLTFAFIIPFLQTLKAVLYYDLRSRREGFGLQLRIGETFAEENITTPQPIFNRFILQTPESVELEFTLGGIGNRIWALVIDYLLLGLILILFLIAWAIVSNQLLNLWTRIFGGNYIGTWLLAIALLIMYAIYTGYFVFFETLWQGQTPGKRCAQIRVIRDDGRPIGLFQATLRSLLRPFDDIVFLGALLIILNKREKRLGDWAAGTIVIQVESASAMNLKLSQPSEIVCEKLSTQANLSELLPDDFVVIREYLQRRTGMEAEAKRQLGLQLATQVQNAIHLAEIPEELTAEQFLEAVYFTYQRSSFS
ncbi:MAG: RDD family protein [Heteroscytonema crispum UTEX LB 1556]